MGDSRNQIAANLCAAPSDWAKSGSRQEPLRRLAQTSHSQDDAELGLAAHHSGVSLGRFFERIRLNHGPDAG